MSGHNKWSKIKNKKGSEDAKKGKVFTKHARNITVAAKEGGTNPDYNPALKTAIEKAKADNMPNDNINRTIKKAAGDTDGDNYESITYEGYGPAGVAVIVNALTDNRNRTAADVRHAFDKNGGNMGQTGCVSFMFDQKGIIIIENEDMDEDEITMDALEAGADDIEVEDGVAEIVTAPSDMGAVRDALAEKYTISSAEVSMVPQTMTELTEEGQINAMTKLLDMLEDNDDVQDVYHNWDMPSED